MHDAFNVTFMHLYCFFHIVRPFAAVASLQWLVPLSNASVVNYQYSECLWFRIELLRYFCMAIYHHLVAFVLNLCQTLFCLQPYETEQWETLAEILMEACIANPAASMELHEVLYGVITPAGHGFSWGQNALKKLMSPLTSIVGFGQQAFRNNQPRDFKQSVSQSESDSEDFQIGTSRSDSMESQPQAETPAPSAAASKLPPRHASVGINEPVPASERLGAVDVSPLAKSAVSSNVPAKSGSPSISTTDKGKRTASVPSHPLEQHMGSTAPVPVPKPGTPAAQASPSAAASSQQTADACKQPSAASTSDRQQPTVSESKQLGTQEAAQAPGASSSQSQAVLDERTDQVRGLPDVFSFHAHFISVAQVKQVATLFQHRCICHDCRFSTKSLTVQSQQTLLLLALLIPYVPCVHMCHLAVCFIILL